MQISTIEGFVEETELVKQELVEDVPCGQCLTTSYHRQGRLVRQDIRIMVKEGLVMGVASGDPEAVAPRSLESPAPGSLETPETP